MKSPFFKCLALAGALVFAWNCSEEASSEASTQEGQQAEEPVFVQSWLIEGDVSYVIIPQADAYIVTDIAGTQIGLFDTANKTIIGMSGEVIAANINLDEQPVMTPERTIVYPNGMIKDFNGNIIAEPNVPASSETLPPPASSAEAVPQSSAAIQSSAAAPASSSSVKSSSSAKSSSSVKSSSSEKSSSSVKSSSSRATTTEFKVKSGGHQGHGWGTRYWDCCKPHCAWPDNAGDNPSSTCDNKMNALGPFFKNICENGVSESDGAGVCDTQAPWAANDQLAFGFAAVPAQDGGKCGVCFLLTFDGGDHQGGGNGLNGKKMVIMVSNIGGDVQQGQFDLMIPGGGVGMFNGCGKQLGIGSMGAQYGGYLSECGGGNKGCLLDKCKQLSKFPKLQAGCEFLANWMNAADNPTFKFEELESCPWELKEKW